MKLVLNASRIGGWDFPTIAAIAKEAGFDGVELGASTDDSQFTSANVLLSNLSKVRGIFDTAGVGIVALSTPLAIDHAEPSFVEQMTGILDASQQLGARIVRIRQQASITVRRRREVPGDQLLRVGDVAAGLNVRIVVENAAAAGSVKEIWVLLERLGHPAFGCSLSLLNLTLARQSPYQVVPMLNQKIFHAEVADARLDGAEMTQRKIGEGDVPVEEFLTRLLGIGYRGDVALELRGEAGAEGIARDAVLKLRECAQPREASTKAARRTKASAQ